MPKNAVAILFLLSLTGCSHDEAPALLQSADGKYRVLFVGEGKWLEAEGRQQMEAALARLPKIDLVYAHNDPMAHGAALAARSQQRTGIRFVGVDGLEHEGRRYVHDGLLDATFEYPTCAAAALDLAVLACRGIELKRSVRLPTRAFTAAEPDGRVITPTLSAATDRTPTLVEAIYLEDLRRRYASLLTAKTPVLRIGMAQCNDAEPWREAMREDMKAWAKGRDNVQFEYRDAANDTQKQRDIVADLVAQKYDAILVSPKESLALAPACKDALAHGVKIIVLDRELGSDDFTCFVGGDNTEIGRAVGAEIKRLLPEGGNLVEIQGLMTSSPAQERHQGFVEALGLAPPKAH